MTIRFFHPPKSVGTKIADLLPTGFREARGAAPDEFDRFSGRPSMPPGFPTQTHTAFGTRSFALVSASAVLRRNGKFGAKIWGRKARRRHLSAMGMCQRIATL